MTEAQDALAHSLTQLPPPAAPLNEEQRRILKQTAGGGDLTDDEFLLFLAVAGRVGLDPLTKQIVATKFNDARTGRKEMVLIVAITGARTVSQRAGVDDGMDPIQFTTDGLNWTGVWLDDKAPPAAARATVYRRGSAHPYTATVTYKEFVQRGKDGQPGRFWARMPSHMLGKCAEMAARRMAFSDLLSGLYAPEEFGQIQADMVVDAGPGPVPPRATQGKQPPALPAPGAPNAPGTSSASPADDNWLAPLNWRLLSDLPQKDQPTTETMATWHQDGGRTRQFLNLMAAHEAAHGKDCQHVTQEARDALTRLGL